MNTTSKILSVLAIVALSIATGSTVYADNPNFLQYGELGHQEDESYFYHDGVLYINSVPSQGNGLFIAESDIENEYSINDAIKRFSIDEDVTSFTVQPSDLSDVVITYELDNDLQFQIVSIQ